MENLIFILVPLIMISSALWYAFQIFRGKVKPAASTWVIIMLGTFLSLITYLIASNWNFKGGILNIADTLAVTVIIFSIFLFSRTKTQFRPFEKWYLVGAAGVVFFWTLSDNPFVSNLLIQLLMWIGYFPTVQKLVKEKINTESFFAWGETLLAGLIALYPTIKTRNILPLIYVSRTIIMATTILSLMYYYERRIKKNFRKN